MNKREQIEDIQKILPNIEVVKAMYGDFDLAELLYDRGCRKISKNIESIWNKYDIKIDMLEKINTNLQELNENYYNEAIYLRRELKQARNETAKEIAEKLKNYIRQNEIQTTFFGNKCFINEGTIDELLKEYEVK